MELGRIIFNSESRNIFNMKLCGWKIVASKLSSADYFMLDMIAENIKPLKVNKVILI